MLQFILRLFRRKERNKDGEYSPGYLEFLKFITYNLYGCCFFNHVSLPRNRRKLGIDEHTNNKHNAFYFRSGTEFYNRAI